MAITTTTELADYMQRTLGELADILEWTALPGDYQDAIDETLLAYGVDTVAEATHQAKLRSLARRELWRAVRDATAGYYDLSSPDGESLSRAQIHQHATTMYDAAVLATAYYDPASRVRVTRLASASDPYRRES